MLVEIRHKDQNYLIHTAWAEQANGPGWSNLLYWVIVSEIGGPNHGKLKKVSLQYEEMNDRLKHLFDVSRSLHHEVVGAAAQAFEMKLERDDGDCSKRREVQDKDKRGD